MRVLILGGDGYLGWPTAMRFSGKGHDVAVVDNFARRRWHQDAGTDSLTPIATLEERIAAWKEVSGKTIESHVNNIFSKLRLAPASDDHRRVLAVLAFLGSLTPCACKLPESLPSKRS